MSSLLWWQGNGCLIGVGTVSPFFILLKTLYHAQICTVNLIQFIVI